VAAKSARGDANPMLLSMSCIGAAFVQSIAAPAPAKAGLRDVAHVAHPYIESSILSNIVAAGVKQRWPTLPGRRPVSASRFWTEQSSLHAATTSRGGAQPLRAACGGPPA
jgi:hypothetical protein